MHRGKHRPEGQENYREFGHADPVERYKRDKRGRHNNITISISRKDGALFGVLDEHRNSGETMSMVIVNALWNTYGGKLIETTKQIIYNDYKTGRLQLPEKIRKDSLVEEPDFDSFEQILAQELACTPIDDIAPKWNIRQSHFAILVLQYITLMPDEYQY